MKLLALLAGLALTVSTVTALVPQKHEDFDPSANATINDRGVKYGPHGRCSLHLTVWEYCERHKGAKKTFGLIPYIRDGAGNVTMEPKGGYWGGQWYQLVSGVIKIPLYGWDLHGSWATGPERVRWTYFPGGGSENRCDWDSARDKDPARHCGDCKQGPFNNPPMKCGGKKWRRERKAEMDCSFNC